MNVERLTLDPAQIVPPIVNDIWPDIVPLHAITIVDAITEDGRRALFTLVDTQQPDWVTIGLLETVKTEVTALWAAETVYVTEDEDEEEEDDEDEYDEYDDD